ncbi:MAG: hypothetical protein HPY70_14935 [Firmicutes bacterium]|nr:hypothetical protein [Bacillota bacterium]
MKRKVGWEGGSCSIMYDVVENRLFHYEQDCEEVHRRYGGELYYTSRTGMTGEGYITDTRNLIFLSQYRTDCRGPMTYTQPHVLPCGAKMQIMAPISHFYF